MHCPFCGFEDTQVKDSRPSEDGAAIRRRRFCTSCESRFTTFERVQIRELIVIKKNGERRLFDRDKLTRSINVAVRKRPVTPEQVDIAVNNIVRELEKTGESELDTPRIGEAVMKALKGLDPVAYVRYASVYKDFSELDDFGKFVDQMAK
ncbi:MAG: transcriptional repressor NrdR [Proteobacteria bacterium]|nr:transcriptional repressor NrdR [Pseudomonadota bacterium]